MKLTRALGPALTALLLSAALACGGGSGSNNGGGGGGGSGGGGGGAVGAQNTVDVTAGQATSSVNITVAAPASTPTPNATALGVATSLSGASAFNTGATIPRNTTRTVLLFGDGLSGSMQVSLTGPSDIAISNIQSIMATDNTPGVAFTATVDANAALGARTIILRDTKDDITTFSGGLEVVP